MSWYKVLSESLACWTWFEFVISWVKLMKQKNVQIVLFMWSFTKIEQIIQCVQFNRSNFSSFQVLAPSVLLSCNQFNERCVLLNTLYQRNVVDDGLTKLVQENQPETRETKRERSKCEMFLVNDDCNFFVVLMFDLIATCWLNGVVRYTKGYQIHIHTYYIESHIQYWVLFITEECSKRLAYLM